MEDSNFVTDNSPSKDKGKDSARTITSKPIACTSTTSTDHKGQVHSQQVVLVLSQLLFKLNH